MYIMGGGGHRVLVHFCPKSVYNMPRHPSPHTSIAEAPSAAEVVPIIVRTEARGRRRRVIPLPFAGAAVIVFTGATTVVGSCVVLGFWGPAVVCGDIRECLDNGKF